MAEGETRNLKGYPHPPALSPPRCSLRASHSDLRGPLGSHKGSPQGLCPGCLLRWELSSPAACLAHSLSVRESAPHPHPPQLPYCFCFP